MNIETGNIARFWDDSFKSFPYVKQPIAQEEIDEWNSLGYFESNVKSFTGSMYDNRNPMPNWIEQLEDRFGLYKQTYTFYRMETCEIMPVHSDHFRTYCRLNNTTPDQVYRVVVMLEDWKPGHYFEMNNVGYTNWRAGDWFKWKGDTSHAASNIGTDPRYTLQITGVSTLQGQLNKLFMFNIPNSPEQPDIRHPLIRHQIVPEVLSEDPNRRVMVYMNNRHITELDNLTFDDDGSEPVHIYLYEPLCCYDVNTEVKHNFYSEISSDIDIKNLRAEELDSIYDFAVRNNTNIIVHTGDYNVEKYYTHYTDRIKLVCDDLFLTACKRIHNLNETINLNFNKKFINLNWRFTKHRQFIAAYLAGKDGYLTWNYKYDFDTLPLNTPFDFDNWKNKHSELFNELKNGTDIINREAPFTVDIKSSTAQTVDNPFMCIWPEAEGYSPGVSPSLFNKQSNSIEPFYRDVFVDIVTESRYSQPTGNISEKILQAIQYQKPFILVAPPYSLEYLRTFGFKTFSDFWDESYDTEEDHGERLAKIFKTIDFILDKPIEELREMYKEMLPIIQYNLQAFKDLKWNKKENY